MLDLAKLERLFSLDRSSRIRKFISRALNDYNMIAENDHISVAVSGGKDSSSLLWHLNEIKKISPVNFKLTAVIVDQKQPGFEMSAFADWVESFGIELHVLQEDTYSIVKEKTPEGKAFCSLCSRLRRGILYSDAKKRGVDKIALGHHRDDLNETLLLNMFFSGSLSSMPPILHSDDGDNTVIRPMVYIPEEWNKEWAGMTNIPIIPCNLCGSQSGLKRQSVKKLLKTIQAEWNPNVGSSLLNAQKNIRLSQLSDPKRLNI